MTGTGPEAGFLLILLFLAGPMLAATTAIGIFYVVSDRRGIRLTFWVLFAICAVAGTWLALSEPSLWRDLMSGKFYAQLAPESDLGTTRVVPWASMCLILIPIIRLIVRRRF
jgi:hypothetical protein